MTIPSPQTTAHASDIDPDHPNALDTTMAAAETNTRYLELHLDMSASEAPERIENIRMALAATRPDDHRRRTALLSAMVMAQSLTDPATAVRTLADAKHSAGLAAGTHGGSTAATAPVHDECDNVFVLLAEFTIDLSPEALSRRRTLATRALDMLSDPDCDASWPGLAPCVYFAYLSTLTESGDVRALDEALSQHAHLADHLTDLTNHRFATWFRCSRATIDGHLTLAERLAGDAYSLAVADGDVDADTVWAGQTAVIRWMQGRISEMEQVFLHARQADPHEPVWAAAVAWIWVHQGRMRAARGLLDSMPAIAHLPQGRNYLAALALFAEVVAAVGTPAENLHLRKALTPFGDRVITMGLGITSWGTVARPLALLAHARGDIDQARDWYLTSIDISSRMGAQPWLARAQTELAALYFQYGDTAQAAPLVAESSAAAASLGLRYIEQQANRLMRALATPDQIPPLSATRPAVQPPGGLTASATLPLQPTPAAAHSRSIADIGSAPGERHTRISVLGGFSVTYPDGSTVTWKSRKAATLLKILIARRGAPLARETAMDLLWPNQDPGQLQNRLSVALTAVRRSLDPGREHSANHFLVASSGSIQLRLDTLSIDVEDFFTLADSARQTPGTEPDRREALLRETIAAYTGDALADEPYAAWAEQLREQAHLAFFGASHALAELVTAQGDHLRSAELYRDIIALDPYDLGAHDGLISALDHLGASSHVATASEERHQRMAELGLSAG